MQRFDKHYPHYAGHFARVIDFRVEYAQSLIDAFSALEKPPHIAISVDMLDTGIDVPEVVNLVFFKPVRSKTKFWQMLGRGTRLCADLYGPGKDKKNFYIFDVCGNLEFFSQPVNTPAGDTVPGLNEKIFGLRVELIGELDHANPEDALRQLRKGTAEQLRTHVAAMPLENFLVRNKRRLVEKYSDPAAWEQLDVEAQGELTHEVAGLPSVVADADLEAKQFDVLMLNLQLAVLRVEARFDELKESVIELAGAMEEKQAIPMVRDQIQLIQEVQTTQFWQGVTVPELENVRLKLRALVKFVDKQRRRPVYTNFEDLLRSVDSVALPIGGSTGVDTDRLRDKALVFLRGHMDDPALHKVRLNEPLSPSDLAALERMFVEAGVAQRDQLKKVADEEGSWGLFIRSLVGLDRAAAKGAFSHFTQVRTLTAAQLDFVNLVIDHLTQCGWMKPEQLYSSPFTDDFAAGPNAVFTDDTAVQELVAVLSAVRENAIGGLVQTIPSQE